MHCLIIQDVIRFFKKVEDKLQTHSPLLQKLKPIFILMGSVPEGTRIGVGNEMDICVRFQGLPPLHVNEEDPFHVYKPERLPLWMTSFFDTNGQFLLGIFKLELLQAVDSIMPEVFSEVPTRLKPYKLNSKYDFINCVNCSSSYNDAMAQDRMSLFNQCKNCKVTVSQNKVGICLQLGWKHKGFNYSVDNQTKHQEEFTLFTSVDLVPEFRTNPIKIRTFVKERNKGMLEPGHPKEWCSNLEKYLSTDRVLHELGDDVKKILIKMCNVGEDKNYMVQAGQHLKGVKFRSERLKSVFCKVKALKQMLGVTGLSNYLLKKILASDEFVKLEEDTTGDNHLLFKVLTHQSIRNYFSGQIDFLKYEAYSSKRVIPMNERVLTSV